MGCIRDFWPRAETSDLNFAQTKAHVTRREVGLTLSLKGLGEFAQRDLIQGDGDELPSGIEVQAARDVTGIADQAERAKGCQGRGMLGEFLLHPAEQVVGELR